MSFEYKYHREIQEKSSQAKELYDTASDKFEVVITATGVTQ